ncbi:DUF3427 domain-containing protein [Nocardioides bruguierae]|uniref:DUF3427 domain-containing protein n=1 Tax=Nocardioides bruguierae TaxID=2945102 RepID=A0A9X2D6D8_9ACTN|nr:DEAD/DEAH box helicase [Nocardioides bruguierae]MCM0620156.1 DUF3427 domain-containing protein [Nocardioides bruguierae]
MSNAMPQGLYETLLTEAIRQGLSETPDAVVETADVPRGERATALARLVHRAALSAFTAAGEGEEQTTLANQVLALLDQDTAVASPPSELLSIAPPSSSLLQPAPMRRPTTRLSDTALLTNARGEPNLGGELRLEIESADEIDLLCAFVKWYGLRLLEPELARAHAEGRRLRVITTTYLGSTERRAVDRLIRDFGAEVRIQYDNTRTRLHAKSWMFRRHSGFDTAYVGSSNLSRAALLDGVEWNVRVSQVATPNLIDKFNLTFESYWNDPNFEEYDPDRDADKLDDALAEASGRKQGDHVTVSLSGLQVNPYPYQQRMLEELAAERAEHDRHRNLVVAATGTGKTVLAALDYRNLGEAMGRRPSLLFIAHRREILLQSLRTYREVLHDATFGELFEGGRRPERGEHVFASIQSLHSVGIETIAADRFEVVVVDEFHHAEASSYRRVLQHLEPTELLGLTATPERADGADIRTYFDGRIATELRLWDALGADLLCPFHYFAVADGTDLSSISWARGRYDEAALEAMYTGNRARAALVLQEVSDKILDPGSMRALGFCVSVAHAHFMAEEFARAGINARVVSGSTPPTERADALRLLAHGEVQVLFTVDVFNEGLDIPDVDTVLFLRPTDSATIFLQQLGRGLRRTKNKAVLTVLDFVGAQRREFRFDLKLRALTGLSRRGLEREVERDFPLLPAGCQIVMDRVARQLILDNIRGQISGRWKDLVRELRDQPTTDLSFFLGDSGVELADVLKKGNKSWTALQREAGIVDVPELDGEAPLLKRIRAMAHVDDDVRRRGYLALLEEPADLASLSNEQQRLARMLYFTAFPSGPHKSYEEGLAEVRRHPTVTAEVRQVVDLAFSQSRRQTIELGGELAAVPLRVHASYQREEILAALDYASLSRKPTSVMQGVAYSEGLNVDILFITLKKSEADFSPTTMYRDYPIDAHTFHWESQSTTTLRSPTGRRYIDGTSTVLLFVRHEGTDDLGTSPYLFLGPATHLSHRGERPIAITWQLEHAMPAAFLNRAALIER